MPRSCREDARYGRRVAVEGIRTSARQRGATGRCAGASKHAHPLQRPDHHDHGGNETEHLRGQHDEHGRNASEITIHHCTSAGRLPTPLIYRETTTFSRFPLILGGWATHV